MLKESECTDRAKGLGRRKGEGKHSTPLYDQERRSGVLQSLEQCKPKAQPGLFWDRSDLAWLGHLNKLMGAERVMPFHTLESGQHTTLRFWTKENHWSRPNFHSWSIRSQCNKAVNSFHSLSQSLTYWIPKILATDDPSIAEQSTSVRCPGLGPPCALRWRLRGVVATSHKLFSRGGCSPMSRMSLPWVKVAAERAGIRWVWIGRIVSWRRCRWGGGKYVRRDASHCPISSKTIGWSAKANLRIVSTALVVDKSIKVTLNFQHGILPQ